MEVSVLVAQIAAITYIAAGIGALSGKINFNKIIEEFDKSQSLTFISGFFTLVLGALIIHFHNFWVKDWTVMVTIIGWAALLKGIVLIAFPGVIKSFKGFYKNTQVYGAVLIILGLVFGYFGFATT